MRRAGRPDGTGDGGAENAWRVGTVERAAGLGLRSFIPQRVNSRLNLTQHFQ